VDLGMIYYFKGTSLLRGGKFNEAKSCIDKVLAIDPNDTEALVNKGLALDVWIAKGLLHYALGEYSESVDCYDHALKIDSNIGNVWYFKGEALLRIDRSDAQYCFDKAKELGFKINPLGDT
jgi:tetratricopeptide (TPR) repeat protein